MARRLVGALLCLSLRPATQSPWPRREVVELADGRRSNWPLRHRNLELRYRKGEYSLPPTRSGQETNSVKRGPRRPASEPAGPSAADRGAGPGDQDAVPATPVSSAASGSALRSPLPPSPTPSSRASRAPRTGAPRRSACAASPAARAAPAAAYPRSRRRISPRCVAAGAIALGASAAWASSGTCP